MLRSCIRANRLHGVSLHGFLVARRYEHSKRARSNNFFDNLPSTTADLAIGTAAVVIGAGPAGIAAIGNLLEHLPKYGGKIAWIDDTFNAGAISLYHEVPR